jgi:hypothetical protein
VEGGGDRLGLTAEATIFVMDPDGALAFKAKRMADLVYVDGKLQSWKFHEPLSIPEGHSFKVSIPDVTGELEQMLVRAGQLPAVSMGCKVAETTCSVCGHVGADLCEHVRAPERPSDGRTGRDDRFILSADFAPPADRCGSEKGQND